MTQTAAWWPLLLKSLHRHRKQHEARYFQLATVTPDGLPDCRTVVYRGRGERGELLVITDQRSLKIEQLRAQPQVTACWYFPKTREQFRIAGHCQIVHAQDQQPDLLEQRRRLWRDLSDRARAQFLWPAPGRPRAAQREDEDDLDDTDIGDLDAHTPHPNFTLLMIHAQRVDHLLLKGAPHRRQQFRRLDDGRWAVQPVHP